MLASRIEIEDYLGESSWARVVEVNYLSYYAYFRDEAASDFLSDFLIAADELIQSTRTFLESVDPNGEHPSGGGWVSFVLDWIVRRTQELQRHQVRSVMPSRLDREVITELENLKYAQSAMLAMGSYPSGFSMRAMTTAVPTIRSLERVNELLGGVFYTFVLKRSEDEVLSVSFRTRTELEFFRCLVASRIEDLLHFATLTTPNWYYLNTEAQRRSALELRDCLVRAAAGDLDWIDPESALFDKQFDDRW